MDDSLDGRFITRLYLFLCLEFSMDFYVSEGYETGSGEPENAMIRLLLHKTRTTGSSLAIALSLFLSINTFGQDRIRFNREVLPILAENCFLCHGLDKATREADLRLDRRESALSDRNGSPAILPGQPDKSELWNRVNSDDETLVMPPEKSGRKLNDGDKMILRRWIEQGAEYETHWAYLPPKRAVTHDLSDESRMIDFFIQDRLKHAEIAPAPPANRPTLIRRVTLDLIGLPPTPLEIDAFLNDSRPDAYERVVDRLLISHHFGERWARWWLDLAHYADSDGYLQDFLRPTAWRYRQWVVDAFNRDLPFDQFTIQQLAGDLLPDATASQRIPTGFLRNTLSNREGGADLEEYRVRQVVDRTLTVGTTWLALTTGCAECHDHKFDALTQREFYAMYAFFNNSDEVNIDAPLPGEAEPRRLAQLEYEAKRNEILSPVDAEIQNLQKQWEAKLLHTEAHPGEDHRWDRQLEVLGLIWGQGLGEGQLEGLNIVKTPWEKRTPNQQQRLTDYFLNNGQLINPEKFNQFNFAQLAGKLRDLSNSLPSISRAPVMTSSVLKRTTHIHQRGDFRRPGEEVRPGTPAVFLESIPELPSDRLQFARWLVSPKHPLTSRVAVNRFWQELFGRGIVATSENFGVRGESPSHPELLDWLALDFMDRGWSMKKIIRRIVLSETYRQSSRERPELAENDPQNRLLARQTRIRLNGELVRDVALASSGLLNPLVGGPSVRPPQPDSVTMEGFDNKWIPDTGSDRYRRGLYTFIQRTSPFAQLVTFDLPDTSRSCTRRERSNTPLQALNLLNDPVFVEMAQALAGRVLRESDSDDVSHINYAYLLTLAREPKPEELARMQDFLQLQRKTFSADPKHAGLLLEQGKLDGDPAELAAWTSLAGILLNLDEFIVRE